MTTSEQARHELLELIAILEDDQRDLERLSVENGDFLNEEAALLRNTIECIKVAGGIL